MTTTRFEDLGLRAEVLRAVTEAGYTEPTPIQARAIPTVLARRDIIGIAQTGTGKTAGFVLPMLDILAAGRGRARMPRSLILSPTRELATQTARNFETYGRYLSLNMALLIGGVGMGDQEKALEKGVDVLIATPGRLLDWFERGKVLLGGIQIVVIDEADRMLDMGFMPDVERIMSLLVKKQQTLLFSATMPPEVRRLAERFLSDPAEIEVTRPATTVANIDDVVVDVPATRKREALAELIRVQEVPKAIVFCNRKRDIGGVMRYLQKSGFNARDLHGDLEQSHRQATLDQFTSGDIDFLVATDVAARGLDISNMPVVINFDVPMNAEDYVHRIGRTGRAGRKGRAFTLLTRDDSRYLGAIEKLTKRSIPRLALAGEEQPSIEPAPDRAPAARPTRRRPEPRGKETTPLVANVAEREAPAPAMAAPGGEPTRPAAAPERDRTRPAAAQPGRRRPIATRETGPTREGPAARPAGRRPPREAEDRPVVAFGDHVPRFLLVPPPVVAPSRTKAE